MVQVLSTTITLTALTLAALLQFVQAAPKTCYVQKSKTDDTITISQAFKDCQNGGTIVFSKGNTYYPKNLITVKDLKNVYVKFDGDITLPPYDTKFNGRSAYLEISGDNINFIGGGTFIGSGQQWWNAKNNQSPIVMRITATNSVFRGFRIVDAPRGHLALTKCDNVVVEKVYIKSVSKNNNFARNTDAIGFAWSKNIVFRDSDLTNGDDCTAINGGVSNVTVTNVKCRGGHGFSVGSLGKGGSDDYVSDINISGSQCIDCQNGIRITTWPGGKGAVKNVRFENVKLVNTENPIIITTHYCDKSQAYTCETNKDHSLSISDVFINNISGSTSAKNLPIINIDCSEKTPCTNFSMSSISISKNAHTKRNVCNYLTNSNKFSECKE